MRRSWLTGVAAALILLSSAKVLAGSKWTQVDCGGVNELIQASKSLAYGTHSLTYAEYVVLILGNRATISPEGRRVPTNLFEDPMVQSVEELKISKGVAKAYLVTISSENHYPDTKVFCTFTDVQE